MVHDKNVCVWCRKGPQKSSHRDWKQLLLLSTKDAWTKFKLRPIDPERVYVRRATRVARVDVRRRASTSVDVRERPSTRIYADIEHMLKGLRVHTKRVYVRRRT